MWNGDDIIKATGGKALGPIKPITSVSIDSRKLQPGGLFVAIKGERLDGHAYVNSAFASGASAALVSSPPKENVPVIIVEDTLKGLTDIAIAGRKRAKGKIIGVTGSVGKTGTKEAIRVALAGAGKTYATQGNLNNHIGLPLSLANLPPDVKFGVFELGMNHTGEISHLTNILRPDIAVITNIGAAHLEFFESIEKIADAKAEIMEGLSKDGTMILNRDDAFYERLAKQAQKHGIARILTFGAHEKADYRLVNYQLQPLGSQVEAVIAGTPITYRIGTVGRHWALTSLAALAAATAAGADLANAAAALANFHEPEGRGKIREVTLKQGKVTIIDDCYNANPLSMTAAISKLAELPGGGRKIAVLGDMLELGTTAAELHKALLAPLQKHAIDKLYATGSFMKHLYDTAPKAMQGVHTADAQALAKILPGQLQAGDKVLIKGSRGSRMDIVRDAIINKELADAI